MCLLMIVLPACAPTRDPAPLETLEARVAELEGTFTAIAPTLQASPRASPTPTQAATATPSPTLTSTSTPTATPSPALTPSMTPASTVAPAATSTSTTAPSPTPAPGMIPTSTVAPAAGVLITAPADVRAGPGSEYEILGAAIAGQRFPLVGKNAGGDWWQIDFAGTGGWIAADTVVVENADAISVREDVPTARPADATPEPSDTPAPATGDCPYVGNKNSKKLHLATCHYAVETKAENRVCFATRQEAIAQGYQPCKVCKP